MPTKKTTTESAASKKTSTPKKTSARKKSEAKVQAAEPATVATVGVDTSSAGEPGEAGAGKKRTRKAAAAAAEGVPAAETEPVVESVSPTVQPEAGTVAVTKIIAKVDIGYGNTLYLRGEGAELGAWDKGIPMENTGGDEWSWSTNAAGSQTLTFKFLINDQTWSSGDNFTVAAGETATLTPSF